MPARPDSRPWRPFLRFSVQGLIVLVLMIGVWLGWLVHSTRIQRAAVAAITRAEGSVAYDWQWKNHSPIQDGKPLGPRWLVDVFGVDYFGHVVAVVTPSAPDAEVTQIGKFGQLQDLVILNPEEISDASLVHLKGLTRLRSLVLGDSQAVAAHLGVHHLANLGGRLAR